MIDISSKIVTDMKNGSSNMDQVVTTTTEYARLGYKRAVSASEISTNGRVLTSDEKQFLIDRINDELDYQKTDFQVLPSNLVSYDPKVVEYFHNDSISLVNYPRYILLELPSTTGYKDLNELIYDIQIKGYVSIIVHPERCKYVQGNPDYLISLKEGDCLVQPDMNSVAKSESSRLYKTAKGLLERQMVDVVAAEVENVHKAEYVRDGVKTLHEIVDSDYFDLVMRLNPQLAIEDERTDRIPALNKKGGGALLRIFGKRR